MLVDDAFDAIVELENGRFKVHVHCIYVSKQIYRFRIKGGEREMVLRTDFPLVYAQKKRSKPASWKIEEGEQPKSGAAFYMMIEKIEETLKADFKVVR